MQSFIKLGRPNKANFQSSQALIIHVGPYKAILPCECYGSVITATAWLIIRKNLYFVSKKKLKTTTADKHWVNVIRAQ